LQAIKGGFRALLRDVEGDSRAEKEINRCFGAYENWVIDRVWRFNSGEAAREAEKLCVALALRNRGTRPLGNDYVSGLKYEEAEKAVNWAINRVRQSTPRGKFKISVKSARRVPKRNVLNGGKLPNAPDKPLFD